MSLSRPQPIQKKKRLLSGGFFRKFCKGALAFLTAGGIILCSLDALLFVGFSMTLASPVFLIFAGASLLVGGLLAMKAVRDDFAGQKQIERLTEQKLALHKKREAKISALIQALSGLNVELREWQANTKINNLQFQAELRTLQLQIHKLTNETYESIEEANNKIKLLSVHIKLFDAKFRSQFNADQLFLQPSLFLGKGDGPEVAEQFSLFRGIKKFGNRGLAFLGGASTVVGLAGTVVGVMGTSSLLLPPLFLFFLGGIGLAAVLTGLLTCYIDFKLTRLQESKISALEENNHQMEWANTKMGGLIKQVNTMTEVVAAKTEVVKVQNELAEQKRQNESLGRQNGVLWAKLPEPVKKDPGLFREVSRAAKSNEERATQASTTLQRRASGPHQ